MGRIFLEHMGGNRLFSCARCDTNLTNRSELISTRFTGATGRAFLFNRVVNLTYSDVQDRVMLTGRHMMKETEKSLPNYKLKPFILKHLLETTTFLRFIMHYAFLDITCNGDITCKFVKLFESLYQRTYTVQDLAYMYCYLGNHYSYKVRDVSCKSCDSKLGWMYEFATEDNQKYKEGRVILERALVTESDGMEDRIYNDRRHN